MVLDSANRFPYSRAHSRDAAASLAARASETADDEGNTPPLPPTRCPTTSASSIPIPSEAPTPRPPLRASRKEACHEHTCARLAPSTGDGRTLVHVIIPCELGLVRDQTGQNEGYPMRHPGISRRDWLRQCLTGGAGVAVVWSAAGLALAVCSAARQPYSGPS